MRVPQLAGAKVSEDFAAARNSWRFLTVLARRPREFRIADRIGRRQSAAVALQIFALLEDLQSVRQMIATALGSGYKRRE
ncbi:hypothetical protein C5Y93_26190 [Blastopirellula marina]|uniref:Uncharacterized protein n=1 Tax=Blastopirellula marina TaxID=124 RepID=A0A2S8GGM7_9BACT|nr:hypothetical protein C5Y93_26190 [Blastopirellula marina]